MYAKTVKFGTIDQNVGGWGRVVPTFITNFLMVYLPPFLPKISGESHKSTNLRGVGGVESIVPNSFWGAGLPKLIFS